MYYKHSREIGAAAWSRRVRATQRIPRRAGSSSKTEPRPFDEIPGPKALPLVGTLYKYLPVVGEYKLSKLHKNGAAKYAAYGPLVREEIVPGEPIVWVYRPEDIAEVFRADVGRHPERRSHRALFKYRSERRDVYNTGGLLPTNGEDWWRLRKEFQKALSRPQNVFHYVQDTDKAVLRFVEICMRSAGDDALPLLSRLFLELTCLVAFDLKLNAFSEQELRPDSMSTRLINAAFATNSSILALDNGPRLWRFFDTPLYKKLCKAQAYMEKIAVNMVSEKYEKLKKEGPSEKSSLLEIYLTNPALDYKDVVGMACDMLLAGIDTTTYSTAFALYHLARNLESQEKLHEESKRLIPRTEEPITAEALKEASYTKAVVKETFRLNPISVGVGRILQTDVILNGYHVRRGTNVVTQNQITCRLPEYFEQPDSFLPERWIKETKSDKPPVHPYLVLPFGHGPRSCIARRLAAQNMQIFLLRMCRHLKFDWRGGELDVDSVLINKPNGPINLKFHRRA